MNLHIECALAERASVRNILLFGREMWVLYFASKKQWPRTFCISIREHNVGNVSYFYINRDLDIVLIFGAFMFSLNARDAARLNLASTRDAITISALDPDVVGEGIHSKQ